MKAEEDIKVLDLESFCVTGDIIKWQGTIIRIGNISYITKQKFTLPSFPKYSILLILIGIFAMAFNVMAGISSFGTGLLWVGIWYKNREEMKNKTLLTLAMNSGMQLPIVISDLNFLDKVLRVLEAVMKQGSIGTQNITISISNSQIGGNAKILNDMNLN